MYDVNWWQVSSVVFLLIWIFPVNFTRRYIENMYMCLLTSSDDLFCTTSRLLSWFLLDFVQMIVLWCSGACSIIILILTVTFKLLHTILLTLTFMHQGPLGWFCVAKAQRFVSMISVFTSISNEIVDAHFHPCILHRQSVSSQVYIDLEDISAISLAQWTSWNEGFEASDVSCAWHLKLVHLNKVWGCIIAGSLSVAQTMWR